MTTMTPHTIPVLIRVEGSYRDVGAQIGDACGDVLRRERSRSTTSCRRVGPAPSSSRSPRATATSRPKRCRGSSRSSTAPPRPPDVDPLALFACTVEEIWYEPRDTAAARRSTAAAAIWSPPRPRPRTATCWSAHNNDLSPRYRDDLVAIERRSPATPRSSRSATASGSAWDGTPPGCRSPATSWRRTTSGSVSRASSRCARCSATRRSTPWSARRSATTARPRTTTCSRRRTAAS